MTLPVLAQGLLLSILLQIYIITPFEKKTKLNTFSNQQINLLT